MFIKANFETVVVSPDTKTNKFFGGSSCIDVNPEIGIIKVKNVENKLNPNHGKVKCIVINEFNDHYIDEIIYLKKSIFEELKLKGYVIKFENLYSLNKSKVRSKMMAYSMQKRSLKFMAFYSISFPKGLPDDIIRKIHNTCLTRIRKVRKNFSYIWVAERQKNGTLHFHMLTNSWLNIRIINHIYAKAIDNQIKKDLKDFVNYDKSKYNGVDVKLVRDRKNLTKYLTKYLTKNNNKFNGLCWNCDSSTSALITSVYLNDHEFQKIANKVIYMKSFEKQYSIFKPALEFDIYIYGSHRPKLIFETIQEVNEYILKSWFS